MNTTGTITTTTDSDPRSGLRTALWIVGVLALLVGALILAWPDKTAIVVTAIIAVYAVIAGFVYAGLGIFGRSKQGWPRIGHVVLGLVFVIAGALAFTSLGQTAEWLGVFTGLVVGIVWISEGFVALSTLSSAGSKVWAVLFAMLSIFAGILLLFAPLWGAAVLWLLLGLALVVLGIVNIMRAFTID